MPSTLIRPEHRPLAVLVAVAAAGGMLFTCCCGGLGILFSSGKPAPERQNLTVTPEIKAEVGRILSADKWRDQQPSIAPELLPLLQKITPPVAEGIARNVDAILDGDKHTWKEAAFSNRLIACTLITERRLPSASQAEKREQARQLYFDIELFYSDGTAQTKEGQLPLRALLRYLEDNGHSSGAKMKTGIQSEPLNESEEAVRPTDVASRS